MLVKLQEINPFWCWDICWRSYCQGRRMASWKSWILKSFICFCLLSWITRS